MDISSERLIALRRERGWSQEKLAAISGVSERTIQRIESEGNCSLDTKMALASALEVVPGELHSGSETALIISSRIITSWSGVAGLFVLGLIAPLIVLLTAVDGRWEMTSMLLVWGLTVLLVIMNYGIQATYKLFDNTSWIVKYPSHVTGLNTYIIQAKTTIEYSYIVGVVASIVCALTMAVHSPGSADNMQNYLAYSIRPFVYSVLFAELWFRPFKKRMEAMLYEQQIVNKVE